MTTRWTASLDGEKETRWMTILEESVGKPPSLALGSFSDDNPPDCHFPEKLRY